MRIANNFLRSLNDASSVIVCYSVVRGLECDFECYSFSSGIRLRKLSDPEICQLIEREETLFQDDRLPGNPCLLEQPFQLPVDQMSDTNIATANFNELITALRLLKAGCVERQITYTRLEYPGQLGDVGHFTRAINKRHPISQTYILSKADLPDLEQILTAIKFGKIPVQLQTAIERVNFAAERERNDDRLLDLLIAMEAIFSDSQGSNNDKTGLRCAEFVANDNEERKHISQLINDAYRRRNPLGHSEKEKINHTLTLATNEYEIVKELLLIIQSSIRSIIKELLTGKNFHQIIGIELYEINELVEVVETAKSPDEKGRALEELICRLFESISGFSVSSRVRTATEEIDIMLLNNSNDPRFRRESAILLAECKNWSDNCGKNEFVIFKEKIGNRSKRCSLGFLISWNGFAGTIYKEMLRGSREEILVVPIDGKAIRSAVKNGNFEQVLTKAWDDAVTL
jgi:hypothetical protein